MSAFYDHFLQMMRKLREIVKREKLLHSLVLTQWKQNKDKM